MTGKKLTTVSILGALSLFLMVSFAAAAGPPPTDQWKPAFDPSTAKYKATFSNVSHPAIRGEYFGYALRDELWKRTNGQIFIDYKPFSMLGGEVEVLNQLQMGALQGMGVSSVASTNLGPRFGVVNLPFLIDSFDKLDKFVANETLFAHFMNAMDHQGIMGLDITGYGNYGWATETPCKTIADAKKLKIRIAEAAVNQLLYRSWGFNPVVMPWPDVSIALEQGVVPGLDHTPMVCDITQKFEDVKYFTADKLCQGLFIWVVSKAWFNASRGSAGTSRKPQKKSPRRSGRKPVSRKRTRLKKPRPSAFSSSNSLMLKWRFWLNKVMSPTTVCSGNQ